MPLRVVADSNVIISALHVGGNPGTVIDLGRRGTIDLYVSPFILNEVSAALAGPKFRWVRGRITVALAALPVRVIDPGPARLSAVLDAPGNRILECAVAARAQPRPHLHAPGLPRSGLAPVGSAATLHSR